MMIGKIAAAAFLATCAAGFSASALARPTDVDIRVGPPAPRVEVVPAPRRGYVWAPGYWNWRGHRHYWVGGNWVRARRGYVYNQPTWVQEGDRWRFNRGAWARGDRDHDGVPNRFDRHPDNPNRR